jgi:hypothetical protein
MQKNDGANHNYEVEDIPPIFEVILTQAEQLDNGFSNKDAGTNVVDHFSGRLSLRAHCWPLQSQDDCIQ